MESKKEGTILTDERTGHRNRGWGSCSSDRCSYSAFLPDSAILDHARAGRQSLTNESALVVAEGQVEKKSGMDQGTDGGTGDTRVSQRAKAILSPKDLHLWG